MNHSDLRRVEEGARGIGISEWAIEMGDRNDRSSGLVIGVDPSLQVVQVALGVFLLYFARHHDAGHFFQCGLKRE